ncbi:MAG: hypothetical protein JGK21_28025 [Microcoleus sp. PH2017_22_RUC_O_B]|uniref:hypothetical protein n=1 Tax=unclassified Microcoleus TaxID=2642155 RepID=UPI001DF6BF50|nr:MULTISPECIES: hypothetical protein [unclassified Microcoleus]MCC3531795.1 hypothetical protein [Microcoleus sp. PH2017_21_RUC_O_A]MCC3544114.1 hypothetical protein [Microcoleus sp. PH2017_22_RUC_O_B]
MIIVILPSRNEARNIKNITKIIDIGLSSYYPNVNSLILNVDSSNLDNTASIFESSDTITSKKSLLLTKKKIGKGFNIKTGINYGISNNFKYFLTIDSDISSIEPYWIKAYLDRLLFFSDDFVTPIYKRNRYEGNTTNHFSSPLLYACWGVDIQQPIAGDFAFSEPLARKILNSFDIESDYGYGVDTMMTWTALATSSKISQVLLDRKIHNPSFSKITDMFSQVCLSTFYRIYKFRSDILTNIKSENYCQLDLHQNLDIDYSLRPDDKAIEQLQSFISKFVANFVNDSCFTSSKVNEDIWLNQLYSEVLKLLMSDDLQFDNIITMVNAILPFYLSRVINHIDWVASTTPDNTSKFIVEQKERLASIIKANLLFE